VNALLYIVDRTGSELALQTGKYMATIPTQKTMAYNVLMMEKPFCSTLGKTSAYKINSAIMKLSQCPLNGIQPARLEE